jgi:hypothetical protein
MALIRNRVIGNQFVEGLLDFGSQWHLLCASRCCSPLLRFSHDAFVRLLSSQDQADEVFLYRSTELGRAAKKDMAGPWEGVDNFSQSVLPLQVRNGVGYFRGGRMLTPSST